MQGRHMDVCTDCKFSMLATVGTLISSSSWLACRIVVQKYSQACNLKSIRQCIHRNTTSKLKVHQAVYPSKDDHSLR